MSVAAPTPPPSLGARGAAIGMWPHGRPVPRVLSMWGERSFREFPRASRSLCYCPRCPYISGLPCCVGSPRLSDDPPAGRHEGLGGTPGLWDSGTLGLWDWHPTEIGIERH